MVVKLLQVFLSSRINPLALRLLWLTISYEVMPLQRAFQGLQENYLLNSYLILLSSVIALPIIIISKYLALFETNRVEKV